MKYYVSAEAEREGDGTREHSFQRISQAADIAEAGDEVIVLPGIYREYVNPIHAGTVEAPVVYRSEKPLGAVISGAEEVKTWERTEGNVWKARIPNGIFGGYNPYTVLVKDDWYDETVRPVHTGEVYLNGKAMYETADMEGAVHQDVRHGGQPEGFLLRPYAGVDGRKRVFQRGGAF